MRIEAGTSEPSLTSRQFWTIAVLILIFAIFRLVRLDHQSLSLDESFTRVFVLQPWSELFGYVTENDMHPPTYFAFSKLFSVFGSSEFGLRFGSWLLGVLSLPLMYSAGRNLTTGRAHWAGLMALLLTGLSFNHFLISESARSYVAMFFAVSLCASTMCWIVANPAAASRPVWSRAGRGGLLPFATLGIGLALLAWLHNIGVFYSVSIGASLIVLWLTGLKRSGGAFVNLGLTAGLAFLIWMPNLANFLEQSAQVSGGFWVQPPTVTSVIKLVLDVFGHGPEVAALDPIGIALALLICLAGAGAAVLLVLHRDWPRLVVLIFPMVFVLGLMIAVSVLIQPVLMARLVYPAMVFWILLLAYGAASLPLASMRLGVSGALVILFAFGQAYTIRADDQGEPFRDILTTIAANSSGIPTVLTVPNSSAVVLAFHRDAMGLDVVIVPGEGPYPMRAPGLTYPTGWVGVPAITPEGAVRLAATAAAADGDVWLMLRNYWPYDKASYVKPEFDKSYCYQVLAIHGIPWLYFLKLIPLGQSDVDCVRFDGGTHFPFLRETTGQIPLLKAAP